MRQSYGAGTEGVRVGGVSVTAVGINSLVKLAKLLTTLDKDALIKFRAMNERLKPTFQVKLKEYMQKSCADKAGIHRNREKGLKWISNTLDVIPGGLGRGISSLQVIVKDKQAQKFAHIYDVGGVILPKRAEHLAVPTHQLRSGIGIPLHYNLEQPPEEVLNLVQARGMKTVTIPLKTGDKMIIGRIKELGSASKSIYKNIPLYLLTHSVAVTPTYWARDGLYEFTQNYAIPTLVKEGQIEFRKMQKELISGT